MSIKELPHRVKITPWHREGMSTQQWAEIAPGFMVQSKVKVSSKRACALELPGRHVPGSPTDHVLRTSAAW